MKTIKRSEKGIRFNLQFFGGTPENPEDDGYVVVPDELLDRFKTQEEDKTNVDGSTQASTNVQEQLQVQREDQPDAGHEGSHDGQSDQGAGTEGTQEVTSERMVPLHVLTEQRRKYKERYSDYDELKGLVTELTAQLGVTPEQLKTRLIEARAKQLQDAGTPAATAYQQAISESDSRKQQKANLETQMLESVTQLSKKDAYFADAEAYADEIILKMDQVPGLSAEDAYELVRGRVKRAAQQAEAPLKQRAEQGKVVERTVVIDRSQKGARDMSQQKPQESRKRVTETEDRFLKETGVDAKGYLNGRDNTSINQYAQASGKQEKLDRILGRRKR